MGFAETPSTSASSLGPGDRVADTSKAESSQATSDAGCDTARRQGKAAGGMARGGWPDGLRFWGGPLRWIAWQFCELADGTATCAQCEMRYRQPTGLKYAAHPLRDGTVLPELICLIVGCRGRQMQQKCRGFQVRLTGVLILKTQVFLYNSTVC